ncbi:hypothetical protein I4F81_004345 [Pyropia yezoensis]|uniref:Uncharacterized protein n=1 Tax=Pyropia yezoensis TaxID=2788 RepID=A0ACC3BUX0_PYRYE|nr:hypothetical protein I4F81_004345 [Neopyropia yezoensis]
MAATEGCRPGQWCPQQKRRGEAPPVAAAPRQAAAPPAEAAPSAGPAPWGPSHRRRCRRCRQPPPAGARHRKTPLAEHGRPACRLGGCRRQEQQRLRRRRTPQKRPPPPSAAPTNGGQTTQRPGQQRLSARYAPIRGRRPRDGRVRTTGGEDVAWRRAAERTHARVKRRRAQPVLRRAVPTRPTRATGGVPRRGGTGSGSGGDPAPPDRAASSSTSPNPSGSQAPTPTPSTPCV